MKDSGAHSPMLEVKREFLDQLTGMFYAVLKGTPLEPLALPAEYPEDELRQLYDYASRFVAEYERLAEFIYALSRGELEFEPPRGKMRALQSFKSLQASLRHLTWKTKAIAAGDFDQQVDFIGDFSNAFNQMTQQLKQSFTTIEHQNQELSRLNGDLAAKNKEIQESREAAVAAARARRVFLDNSGQCFLSVRPDLRVDPEYSKECRSIFGKSIADEPVIQLFYPDDEAAQATLERNFRRVFDELDPFRQELYLSLWKKEYRLGDTFVEAEHKLVQGRVLCILTDVTRRKKLENEVLLERNRLKFVVSTVRESHNFFDILDDFDAFRYRELPALLGGFTEIAEKLSIIYLRAHTFKGLFAQQDFLHMPAALHEFESSIAEMQQGQVYSGLELARLCERLAEAPALRRDLSVVEEFLGKEFLQQRGSVLLNRDLADKMQVLAETLLVEHSGRLDAESRELLAKVKNISSVNFKELLSGYPKGAQKLAERQGKALLPFIIEGDDVFVDHDVFAPFAKSLVHVFRNAVDHGLETPDERAELGKDEAGCVQCRISSQDGVMRVLIADDGRGLDTARLRAAASERGLMSSQEAQQLEDKDVFQLIFVKRVSTCATVSEVSGRGVGLAAVKQELELLGGTVEVESRPGQGASLCFNLPLAAKKKEGSRAPLRVEIERLIQAVARRSVTFLREEMGLEVEEVARTPQCVTRLVLRDTTAMVSVGGNMGVYIALSFDAPAIRHIFLAYTQDLDIPSDQEPTYIDETAADVVNTIVGNALSDAPDGATAISLTPPVVMSQAKSLICHKDAYFYLSDLCTPLGDISIMYIGPKSLFDETLESRENT